MNSNKKKGIIFIIISAFSFATMSLFVQLAGDVPFIQKTLFRNLVSVFFAFFLIMRTDRNFTYKKENLKYFLIRSTFGSVAIFANFYAIENLILSDASIIAKLSPFFVIIFSAIVLKEKVKPWQIACIVIAFIGSMFIVNPSIIMSLITGAAIETSMTAFPASMGLLGAVGAGVAYTFIRKLSMAGERGPFIVFFFSLFTTIFCLPFVIFSYQPMTTSQYLYLLGAGLFASFGQFAVTAAYGNAPAKEISIYDYSQILFAALYSLIIFNEVPSGYSLIGYAIIISVAAYMFYKDGKEVPKATN